MLGRIYSWRIATLPIVVLVATLSLTQSRTAALWLRSRQSGLQLGFFFAHSSEFWPSRPGSLRWRRYFSLRLWESISRAARPDCTAFPAAGQIEELRNFARPGSDLGVRLEPL